MTADTPNPAAPPPASPSPGRRRMQAKRTRLLTLLWEGRLTPPEICTALKITPRRLGELVAHRSFRRAVKGIETLGVYRRDLGLTRAAHVAVESLLSLACGAGETARKACLDLLRLRADYMPADQAHAALPQSDLEQRVDAVLSQLAADTDEPAEPAEGRP